MKNKVSENQDKTMMTVSQAGRKGGFATLQSQGIEHFKKIGQKGGKQTAKLYRHLLSEYGKRGGRPRLPKLTDSMEEENR